MKKINNLSETSFLKLFFAFLTVCFIAAAFCMPDRSTMFSGLWQILSQPSKISSNYFDVGGYAATFLNMGLVMLVCTLLYVLLGATANAGSALAFVLTLGFSSWGINILNIWPTFLGVILYCLVKKERINTHVNTMLFSTGIAPLITDLMIRYPSTEVIGFNAVGILLALVVGIFIGFILPAGLAHSPKVHKGFDLFSAALPIGMTAFFLNAVLYKTMGLDVSALSTSGSLTVASAAIVNIFCCVVFGLCVVLALLMGAKVKDYWKFISCGRQVTSVTSTHGNALFLLNVGVYGLFILAYYNLIGGTFNSITFGIIFCMLSTCNSGSHPGNVWPIIAGYVLASLACTGLSTLAGGSFAGAINAQAIMVGLCYANGLSPIADKYGWPHAILAGAMHYLLVTSVPTLHGGYCLYNGGFTAALICIILVPQLERFCKTKEERRALKAAK